MSKNSEILKLVSSLFQTVVDEAEIRAEEREKGLPSYQTGQLGTDLELLKATTVLMRQMLFLQAIEDLIQVAYYSGRSRAESSKRVEEALNKVIWQIMSAVSSM